VVGGALAALAGFFCNVYGVQKCSLGSIAGQKKAQFGVSLFTKSIE
jgi:hypothetical protein